MPTKKGFTLIETLVAVTVLSMALIPPIYTAYQSVIATNFARDQMIASYLAQDAMDYIIAKKNQNIIACTNAGDDGIQGGGGINDDDKGQDSVNDYPCDEYGQGLGRDWLADLDLCNATGVANANKKCVVDTTREKDQPYVYTFLPTCVDGTSSDCYIYFDKERNLYRHSNVITEVTNPANKQQTKFRRYVSFKTLSGGNEAAVAVVVKWKAQGFTTDDSVTVRSNIFNVKP
ncbi:type II secretion system GspH family protein [Candidatus Parcubacteria bacterium]|nr:type II secretion system GspH family protein [Candidatus Parcubacteria bacterium]